MSTATIVAGAAALAGAFAGIWVLWQVAHVILVLFAGVLLAVIWRNLGARVARLPGLSPRVGTMLVVLASFVAVGAFVWLAGPLIASQMDQLTENVARSLSRLHGEVREFGWGRWILDEALPSLGGGGGSSDLLGRITGMFSTVFGVLGNLVVILMVGIYAAVAPDEYRSGIENLFPRRHRTRVREVLHGVSRGLWHWLLGQLVAMVGVGVATTVGLWLLGIPLAIVLGVIAGLLNFVPLLGPVLSAIPAVLVAFAQGPADAFYVALLFFGVQQLEGNVLTPLAQHRAVKLPPATILASLLAFGVLFGPMGVLLATPLAVVVAVLTKMLYVEGVLGEKATDLP